MRYRVAFAKRESAKENERAMRPSAELDMNLADGIVADKVLIEELPSEADHGEDVLDEDDAFLGLAAAEVWEYNVVDNRTEEFERAVADSDLVIEYDVVDMSETPAEDAVDRPAKARSVFPPERGDSELDANAASLTVGPKQTEKNKRPRP